jgi:transcriptional regulator with XRE-family HTH domain
MNTNNLAKKLKELRAKRGISQEFLADESRVSLRTIQRIENEESKPTGETIKRIAFALDIEFNELMESSVLEKTIDLQGTILFLKKQLSNTNKKSEIKTFEKFIDILQHLKEKKLSAEQLKGIESYISYLELEKIPNFSNELYKQKLKKFRKYLTDKLRFVPNNYYRTLALLFAVPFAISFSIQPKIDFSIKISVIIAVILLVIAGIIIDVRIQKQNRSLNF